MEHIQPLINVGLSEKQALVYNALLELGEGNMSSIAKHSRLKRPTVYLIVEELVKLSLVSLIQKRNKKMYSAAHPERIAEILESRNKQFKELLPDLLARFGTFGNKPKVQMLEGMDGIKHAYQEAYRLLQDNKHEGLWFGNISFLLENFPEVIAEYNSILQPLKEYTIREIITGGEKSKKWVDKMQKNLQYSHQIKYFNDNKECGMTDQFIIGNKIMFFSMNKEIFTLIIDSEELVKTQKFVFNQIWKNL